MKKSVMLFLIFGLVFLIIPNLLLAKQISGKENDIYMKNERKFFKENWEKVKEFEEKGLTKSSFEIVKDVFEKAIKDNNSEQIIKSLMYKMKYMQEIEEESVVKIQNEINKVIENSSFPTTNILYSIKAEMYWNYYSQNYYKILERKSVLDNNSSDIRTWDIKKIIEEIIFSYNMSLKNNDKLCNINNDEFNEIIKISFYGKKYRKTLYDFLAHRAIDFYSNSKSSLISPAYEFNLNNKDYLLIDSEFIKIEIQTKDKNLFYYNSLIHFQNLMKYHLLNNEIEELIDLDLKRIKFIYDNAIIENKEIVYEELLNKMIKKYKNNNMIGEIEFRKADLFKELGEKWSVNSSIQYRYHKKKSVEMCNDLIKKYPNTNLEKRSLELLSRIKNRSLKFETEKVNIPNQEFLGLLTYQNIEKVFLRIYKIENSFNGDNYYNLQDKVKKIKEEKNYIEYNFDLSENTDYQMHKTEIKIPKLELGSYLLLFSNDNKFDNKYSTLAFNFINSSNIAYISKKENEINKINIIKRDTGHVIKNCKIELWNRKYDSKKSKFDFFEKEKNYITDEKGYLELGFQENLDRNYYIKLINGDDILNVNESFYNNKSFNNSIEKKVTTKFFTDRKIYRPGQTIFFKGIIFESNTKDPNLNKILKGYSTEIDFIDANGEKNSSINLISNDFGTFNGSFQIPMNKLNGIMTIKNRFGSEYINIEEYKRPSFEVEINDLEKEYKLDDIININGSAKAFAGYAINDAEVKYRVVRYTKYGLYYIFSHEGETEITSGTVISDKDGNFKFDFKAIANKTIEKRDDLFFSYKVFVDVIDANGETRSEIKNINIGYKSMFLEMNVSEYIDKENKENKMNIDIKNLSGVSMLKKGKIEFYKLKENKNILYNKKWDYPDEFIIDEKEYKNLFPNFVYKKENEDINKEKGRKVLEIDFDTSVNKNIEFSKINKLKSGKYLLVASSIDKFGELISENKIIKIFSSNEQKMPFKESELFIINDKNYEPGEILQIIIATSEEDVNLMYQIKYKGDNEETKFLKLDNSLAKINIKIKEEYRGNFSFDYIFIKNNRYYSNNKEIKVPWNNKKLDISFETFRDKLKPGEKEEWRIKIKNSLGDKILSEMAASLYDASLDTFAKHNWDYNFYNKFNYWNNINTNFYIDHSEAMGNYTDSIYYDRNRIYNHLNTFGFYWWDNTFPIMRKGLRSNESNASLGFVNDELMTFRSFEMDNETMALSSVGGGDFDYKISSSDKKIEELKTKEVKIRENLNETAFFYPNLKTNENGEVIISFTAPEAISKWKMLGFANTKNLEYGFISNELVTKKELMIQPNFPRFFREGDKIKVSSKIINLSENQLSGIAELKLLDSITKKEINRKFNNINSDKKFEVDKDKSVSVTWDLEIPKDVKSIIYQVFAKSKDFTDGEENILPILTNRILITESMPLPLRENENKKFKFKSLIDSNKSKTIKNHRLTLEFTSNPIWTVIQSLPYLMEYPYDCMEQTFTKYYANSISKNIIESKPKIKRVFDTWKLDEDINSFYSNLEKNQELKALFLEETPWVMEAKDEKERKRRLSILFDFNKMKNESDRALNKLKEGQMENGAWPWFSGMIDNRYISQYIVTGFAHLNRMGIIEIDKNDELRLIIEKAITYLDKEIKKDYDRLLFNKSDLKLNQLSYLQIHYLYARSYFNDFSFAKENIESFEFYKKQAKEFWLDFNKYSQGMIAISMNKYHENQLALDILESLKENAIYSEEMGMYWKNNNGYYWYQSAIETQSLLIEAFSEISEDSKSVNAMKTWLLKQKQVQDWKTTKATAEACYALLLNSDDWLDENNMPDIRIGGKKLEINKDLDIKVEEGTGYFKTTWNEEDINSKLGTIEIKNNNNAPAWGGIYWQYFENIDKIKSHKTSLKVNKKLFVERNSDNGLVIVPIEKQKINLGDRIITRIEIELDRDMEYIHLKDMRASGFEPENVISGYKWQGGLGYYETTKDSSTNFFFDYLPKGKYVFEYPVRVFNLGEFSNGIAQIQSMYAPEFTSHSNGNRIKIGQ